MSSFIWDENRDGFSILFIANWLIIFQNVF